MADTRLLAVSAALFVAGLVLGAGAVYLLAGSGGGGAAVGEVRVYYVVPVEWTFGLYDENWRPVERIEVSKGDRVLLVIVPRTFVPPEIYEELEERFIEEAKAQGLLAGEEDFKRYEEDAVKQLGKEAYGLEYIPHGVAIEGYEDRVNVVLTEGNIVVVEFTADKPGSFDIYCSNFCGWGHGFMRLQDAFGVRG